MRPSRRAVQRSLPPITAASTSSCSQRHGVGTEPATTTSACGSSGKGSSRSAARSAAAAASASSSTTDGGKQLVLGGRHERRRRGGALALGFEIGTCPSERYSAKRRAERPSAAHARSASSARPVGSGPRRAAGEERRDVGAAERLLEVRRVLARRVEEDGHAIERHAARGLSANPARDLDAFPRLARPGMQRHGRVEIGGRRRRGLEEVRLQAARARSARPRAEAPTARRRARASEGERALVAGRHGREQRRRAPRQRGDQPGLAVARDRHVEEGIGVRPRTPWASLRSSPPTPPPPPSPPRTPRPDPRAPPPRARPPSRPPAPRDPDRPSATPTRARRHAVRTQLVRCVRATASGNPGRPATGVK